MSLLKKLKRGLLMTHDEMWYHLKGLFQSAESETWKEKIEEALLTSDAGPEFTFALMEKLSSLHTSQPEEVFSTLQEEMVHTLGQFPPLQLFPNSPTVILLVGVNGTGKTTTAAKLANLAKKEGKSSLLVAGDTFRAGAIEQLTIWAKKVPSECFCLSPGSDPGAVVYQGLEKGIKTNKDVIIIDTAGRLHTKKPLMEELKKVYRVCQKVIPDAPHHIFLVLDATTGQNGLQQGKSFSEAVPLSGVIVTKMDGTAKGGIVLQIAKELKLPVRFIGVGEGMEDLLPFDPQSFVDALLSA